jgi:DNA replication protein DnaC
MLIEPTIDGLKSLKLTGMIKALESQMRTPDAGAFSFEERLGNLVDAEISLRENRRVMGRLKTAKLTHSPSIEEFDVRGRGVDRSLLLSLSSSDWARRKQNILVDGKTGVGKSYLAYALAQKACRDGFTVQCDRASRLFNELSIAKADGRYGKLLSSLAKKDVLVIDDFGLFNLNDEQRHDLLEILEDRYLVRSTVITSQVPSEHWYELIGDPTIADAVLDRLVHNAHKIHLDGESRRKGQSE